MLCKTRVIIYTHNLNSFEIGIQLLNKIEKNLNSFLNAFILFNELNQNKNVLSINSMCYFIFS
jgi:hypothetical protein